MSEPGRLVVISGPSGAGKTTICDKLLETTGWRRVVTCTTREPRRGEVDGKDYHFLDREEFERGIRERRFLEHAKVFENYYGTPREEVETGIERGETLLLNIDVQGARQVREAEVTRLVTIFIEPPDLVELKRRLERRSTDSDETTKRRLQVAERELAEKRYYDHVVRNDELNEAVKEVLEILDAPRHAER